MCHSGHNSGWVWGWVFEGGDETQLTNQQMQTRGNALHSEASVHLYSLCQTWLTLKTHTVSVPLSLMKCGFCVSRAMVSAHRLKTTGWKQISMVIASGRSLSFDDRMRTSMGTSAIHCILYPWTRSPDFCYVTQSLVDPSLCQMNHVSVLLGACGVAMWVGLPRFRTKLDALGRAREGWGGGMGGAGAGVQQQAAG